MIFCITRDEPEGERWVLKWLSKFIITQRPPAAKEGPASPGLRPQGLRGNRLASRLRAATTAARAKAFWKAARSGLTPEVDEA
jgi:hypothetical protein